MKVTSKLFPLLCAVLLNGGPILENCPAAQSVVGPAVSLESAAADCHGAGVSADGRFVVFVSRADNLVPNDHNGAFDVFVRDRALVKTILVSVNAPGTHSGNGASVAASISADGRFVAFESSASDLVANDTNNASDIFLRDLVAGTTALASVSTNGVSPGNQPSSWPVMTPDGRFILFESRASNLASNDLNGVVDLFVRDMVSGITTLVTRDRFGTASALGGASVLTGTACMSDDGRWVAFSSNATNLVANDNNQRSDVFVRDLLNRTNLLVSVSTNGFSANNDSSNPAISADGRHVAFQSAANNLVANNLLVTNNVYARDLAARTTVLVSVNQAGGFSPTNSSFGPVISADGRYVAFQSMASDLVADDNPPTTGVPALDVFVRDLQSRTTVMASFHSSQTNSASAYYTNWTRTSNERSALPISISRDGRFVLFQSDGVEETLTNSGGSSFTVFTTFLPGAYVFDHTTGTRTRIGSALFPALSEDGRVVAYQAAVRDQLANDPSIVANIFARDLASGSFELISHGDSTLDSLTANGLSQLTPASVSASGRFLAYESFADNLVANDTNGTSDVFVRDMITGSNELVSANANLTGSIRGPSRLPAISGDGRWIAYETVADDSPFTNGLNNQFSLLVYDRWARTNLLVARVGPANNPGTPSTPVGSSDGRYLVFQSSWPDPAIPNSALGQIYFRDLTQGANVLVSRNQMGNAAGFKPSWNPFITADGARVLFLSAAPDLVTNSVSGTNLFLWEVETRSTTLVSVSTNGGGLNRVSQPSLSADGRLATFLNQNSLYFCDLSLQSCSLVATNASAASLNTDGRFIAFESRDALAGNDTNFLSDIFVYDRNLNKVALISVNLDGTASGNGVSTLPLISPDGRYVVFSSQASDLVANDANGFSDLFLRDITAGTTLLLSVNFTGSGSGNRLSANPVLSADGTTIVFESYALDLTVGDFNGTKDLFVFHLSAGDSDRDGLADEWEVAYFGDLSRDGGGDFDGDGQTDLEEFRAGTDPTNRQSVFRTFTLSHPDLADGLMVLWNAVPGRTYRAQFKDGLEDPNWTDLPGDVLATSATGMKLDNAPQTAPRRFYRVIALP